MTDFNCLLPKWVSNMSKSQDVTDFLRYRSQEVDALDARIFISTMQVRHGNNNNTIIIVWTCHIRDNELVCLTAFRCYECMSLGETHISLLTIRFNFANAIEIWDYISSKCVDCSRWFWMRWTNHEEFLSSYSRHK